MVGICYPVEFTKISKVAMTAVDHRTSTDLDFPVLTTLEYSNLLTPGLLADDFTIRVSTHIHIALEQRLSPQCGPRK